jgi:arginine decarboxylase
LFAGLALQNQMGCLIICNGYKDAEFIKMAMLGIKLGKKVIMVVEKLEELRQIIAISKQLGVEPLLGIRARLLSKGAGRWAESGGENAKFGLSTADLLAAAELLKAENLGHCLKLLHFHIGSQVPDILTVKKAVQEAARLYAKLYKMGFKIEFLDVGGGWAWITTAAGRRSTARRITRCRNTPTTSFITSPTCATRKTCRIRTSSAKADAPSSRITAC